MTNFGVLHASLAASSGAMLFVHLTLWLAVRAERVQLWVALCFACIALLFGCEAATGSLAGGSQSLPWLFATLPAVALHSLMLLTIWALYELPLVGSRRMLLLAVSAGSAVVLGDRALALLAGTRPAVSFVTLLFEGPLRWLSIVLVVLPAIVWIVESVGQVRRRPGLAVSSIFLAAITTVAIPFSFLAGQAEYMLLGGTTFLAFASVTVVAGYIRIARRAELAGEYRLEARIASGGMGELFRAYKVGPGGFSREVALKRIRPEVLGDDAPEFEARFLEEARLTAGLSHPNIVAVHDLGRLDEGGWFLAMEYLHGKSLAEIRTGLTVTERVAPPEVVAAIGEQIARGLAAAHAAGVIHRDVSPHNVMLTRDGVVKLVDFGIAKRTVDPVLRAVPEALQPASGSPGGSGELTLPGTVLGKIGYLAPERIEGAPATALSDLFATGVVLFELATGCRPYRLPGDSSALPRKAHWQPARALRPEIPEALDAALTRALAWPPDARFGSALDLAEALRRVSGSLPWADLGSFVRSFESEPSRAIPAPGATAAQTVALKPH